MYCRVKNSLKHGDNVVKKTITLLQGEFRKPVEFCTASAGDLCPSCAAWSTIVLFMFALACVAGRLRLFSRILHISPGKHGFDLPIPLSTTSKGVLPTEEQPKKNGDNVVKKTKFVTTRVSKTC